MLDMQKKSQQKNIWVVFTGKTDIRWLKILKPGFRHCYALINDGQRWMSIDPLSSYTDIQTYHHIDAQFDLPAWVRGQGSRVVRFKAPDQPFKPAPLMMFSCVEAIKRILGIHKRTIITPWQLYQYLKINSQYQQNKNLKGTISWVV